MFTELNNNLRWHIVGIEINEQILRTANATKSGEVNIRKSFHNSFDPTR